jgi:site-specific recombinase XerD
MTTKGETKAPQSLQEALGDFIGYMTGYRRCSPHTAVAYRADAQGFIRWCEAQDLAQYPRAMTREVVVSYLSALAHLSPNTVRRRLHALRGWCGFMVRQGLLPSNPTDDLPLPKRKRAAPRYPTPDQVDALLAAARTPLEQAAIWLLAGTGLRRAELLSLDLSDLAPDLSELSVVGKGDKERRVPVPTAVREVVGRYLEVRGDAPGALLLNRAGKRVGTTTLRRLFERLARRAGLADAGFSLHGMRHAYATALVRAGVDLGTVRDLLGHSDVAVTSVYIHSDLRSRRDAVEHLPLGKLGGADHG